MTNLEEVFSVGEQYSIFGPKCGDLHLTFLGNIFTAYNMVFLECDTPFGDTKGRVLVNLNKTRFRKNTDNDEPKEDGDFSCPDFPSFFHEDKTYYINYDNTYALTFHGILQIANLTFLKMEDDDSDIRFYELSGVESITRVDEFIKKN